MHAGSWSLRSTSRGLFRATSTRAFPSESVTPNPQNTQPSTPNFTCRPKRQLWLSSSNFIAPALQTGTRLLHLQTPVPLPIRSIAASLAGPSESRSKKRSCVSSVLRTASSVDRARPKQSLACSSRFFSLMKASFTGCRMKARTDSAYSNERDFRAHGPTFQQGKLYDNCTMERPV